MAYVEEQFEAHTKKINVYGRMIAVDLRFFVFEAEDENDALAAVYQFAPKRYMRVPLVSIEIDARTGPNVFKVIARYEFSKNDARASSGGASIGGDDYDKENPPSDLKDEDEEEKEPEPTESFSCGGGTRHVSHSLKQRIVFGTLDPKGLIAWNGKSGDSMQVAGVDVPTAQFRKTYTRVMSKKQLTSDFERMVGNMVGKVNKGSFHGWKPGEVMFRGASYSAPSDNNSAKVVVSFDFMMQPNESEFEICEKKMSKEGFEYAWSITRTSVDADKKSPAVDVVGIYIDQVCPYADFDCLGV